MNTMHQRLVTVTQAAAQLGVSSGYLYKMKGMPGVFQFGRAIRIDVDALLAELAKRRAPRG